MMRSAIYSLCLLIATLLLIEVSWSQLSQDRVIRADKIETNAIGGNLDFDFVTSLILPSGNTAARPTPAAGMFRFNTQTDSFEGYNGTSWEAIQFGIVDLASDVSGILPIANGGTNSNAALANDLVMTSVGGAIVENANVSVTELERLDGITSDLVEVDGAQTITGLKTISRSGADQGLIINQDGAGSALEVNQIGSGLAIDVSGEVEVSGDLTMTGTGALKVPEGAEAQRPVTPATGMLRFNSDSDSFEGYNGIDWAAVGGGAGDALNLVSDPQFLKGTNELTVTDATLGSVTANAPPLGAESNFVTVTYTDDAGFVELEKDLTGSATALQGQQFSAELWIRVNQGETFNFQALRNGSVVVEREIIGTGNFDKYSLSFVSGTSVALRVAQTTNASGDNVDIAGAFLGTKVVEAYASGHRLIAERYLTSQVNSDGAIAELEFTGLVVGKKYKINFTPRTFRVSSSSGNKRTFVDILTGSTFACRWVSQVDGVTRNDQMNTVSCEFEAEASALTFTVAFDGGTLEGTGTKAGTFAQLYEVIEGNYHQFEQAAFATQTKTLSSNVTTTGVLSDLTFTDLEVGAEYEVVFSPTAFRSNATDNRKRTTIFVENGSQFLFRWQCDVESIIRLACSNSSSGKFTASSTSVTFTVDGINNMIVSSEPTSQTHAQLRRLPTNNTFIAELSGTPRIKGERGAFIEGWASFGGATDGSICDSSPCTRYGAVGDVGNGMSMVRTSASSRTLTVSGFKVGAKVMCFGNSQNGSGGRRELHLASPSLFIADSNGEVADIAVGNWTLSGVQEDGYYTIHCKGEAP